MKSSAECSRLRLAALMIVTSLLSACATVGSERIAGVCPPVVEYDAGVQARAAEELKALPDGSAVVEMLSDYAVMREQVRTCRYLRYHSSRGRLSLKTPELIQEFA